MKYTLFPFAALAATILASPHPNPGAKAEPQPPWIPSSVLASLSTAGLLPSNSGPPAAWSSVYQSLVSQGIIPSTVTAPPWATATDGSWGPGNGPYGPHGPGGYHGPWAGSSGYGPWGTGNPWSDWTTNSAWRTNAPWANWWGGSACPGTDWPGWTAGPWSTNAPWTSWAGCSASTTATNVYTTTISGSQVVSTGYGVQVAQAAGNSAGASSGSTGASNSASAIASATSAITAANVQSTGAAMPMKTAAPGLMVGAAMAVVAVL